MSFDRPFFSQHRRSRRAADLRDEVVVGVVVDNKDPLKLGRVKVRLPTISEDASHWATLSSIGAGKDRGWFFLPEIDDEVLVMFAHGDLGRPVVLGALWGGVDKPPEQNGGSNERRVFVSRSGHRVEFDDDEGTITFEDGGGIAVVTIADDGITMVANEGDVQSQSPTDQTHIKASTVSIEASSKLTIKAGGDIKITSGGLAKIDGGSKLTIVGSKVDIKPGSAPEAADAEGSVEAEPDKYG